MEVLMFSSFCFLSEITQANVKTGEIILLFYVSQNNIHNCRSPDSQSTNVSIYSIKCTGYILSKALLVASF